MNSLNSIADTTIAHAAPCGIVGCLGDFHEVTLNPSDWHHDLPELFFGDGSVSVQIFVLPDRSVNGFLEYEARGEMTADELRAEAAQFDAYPAWLRAQADAIDALSV